VTAGLDLAQLESQILREKPGAGGSVLGAVQADERQDVVDPAAFHDGISRSLPLDTWAPRPDPQLPVYLERSTTAELE
jgi:hypothetical protein